MIIAITVVVSIAVLFLSDIGSNGTNVSPQSDIEETINIEEDCKYDNVDYSWLKQDIDFFCKFSNFNFLESWHTPYHPGDNEINKFGFRGLEFSNEKPSDVYRIFLVGGSTVFGDGVRNHATIPTHLQNFYLNTQFDGIKEIEIINAGIAGATSKHESLLIKNKLSKMSPDMIVVYDGWNDSKIGNFEIDKSWSDRWLDICNTYGEEFDIIITLQPVLSNAKKIMTDQEYINYHTRVGISQEIENLGKLATHLDKLNVECSSAHDLRHIMNDEHVGIFYDQGHMTPTGNKIIAKKIYEITLPIIEKNHKSITLFDDKKMNYDEDNTQTELDQKIDFRGRFVEKENFSSTDISKMVAYLANFIDVDFSLSKINSMDSKFSKFTNVDFSDAELQNSRISRTIFAQSDFSNTDLSGSYIAASFFTNSNLANSSFLNSNLNGVRIIDSVLTNTKFQNADLSHSYLENLDFTSSYLQNSKFTGGRIMSSSFDGMDFSTLEIHGDSLSPTEFTHCTMTHTTFPNLDMTNVDFTPKIVPLNNESILYGGTNLSASLFVDSDLRTTMFSRSSFVDGFLENNNISSDEYRKYVSVMLDDSKFYNVNLSYNDLGFISLRHAEIIDSDLTGVSLINSDLSFSSITNSNLSGANLSGANLSGANLDRVNLDGADLNCLNHPVCLNQ